VEIFTIIIENSEFSEFVFLFSLSWFFSSPTLFFHVELAIFIDLFFKHDYTILLSTCLWSNSNVPKNIYIIFILNHWGVKRGRMGLIYEFQQQMGFTLSIYMELVNSIK
jgi:hypothetical protein